MTRPVDPAKLALLEAIVPHVPFDGWSSAAFEAAVASSDISRAEAKVLCPRGAVDLAVLFHQEGDRAMVEAVRAADLSDMRFRDKVAFAVRARLNAIDDKEAVRRGSVLFALPIYAADGAKLIWGTADAIWDVLGDTSRDINWYTKRATLSGVYGSCVLYWLGDDSSDAGATEAFIDRRIGDVMQFETVKAKVNGSKVLAPFLAPLNHLAGMVKAPSRQPRTDVPGMWSPRE